MSPTKEYELQKIADQLNPEVDNEESSTLKKFYSEKPDGPSSPEEEAKLQAELDAEVKARQEKQKADSEKRLNTMKVSTGEVGVAPEENKVSEDSKAPKAPFCTECDSKGVVHKKNCPTKLITNEVK
jgi:hypothetical protein